MFLGNWSKKKDTCNMFDIQVSWKKTSCVSNLAHLSMLTS